MLNIVLWSRGLQCKNRIAEVSSYFDAQYETEWFQSDLAKAIVKAIDDTEYIKGEYFESPVFGGISPRDLSTGCKGLLLLLNEDDIVVSGERFGNNCAEWILRIAEMKDITISIHHVLKFPEPFNIYCMNTGKILTSYKEYIRELAEVAVREG